ncbi:hypothetical protein ACHAWX_005892 [Stephanocyclus meneghinianus]
MAALLISRLLPLAAFVHTCLRHHVSAIVVKSPFRIPQTTIPSGPLNRQASPASSQTSNATTLSTRRQFRIRKTKSSDINAIAAMLAMASTGNNQQLNDWNRGIEFLRAKSSLEKQLCHRLLAVEEGRKTMLSSKSANTYFDFSTDNVEECPINNLDTTCGLLWANDNFRSKLKSAVMISSERNAWERHNFDLTPLDPALFNHLMMTVIQTCHSDDVVGFCEVAWLPRPDSDFSGDHLDCAPSIVNLITSPLYRRRGIASKLIDVASRYARTQWEKRVIDSTRRCTARKSLGLYVHPKNASALYLYHKKGFKVEQESEDGLLYMMMSA